MPLVDAAYEGLGQDAPWCESINRPAAPDNSQPRVAGQSKSLVISGQFWLKKTKAPGSPGAVRLLSQASNLTPKVPALTQFNPALDAEGLHGSTRK